MGLVVKNPLFTIVVAVLLAAPVFAAGPRPWLVYCNISYSLIGTADEPKEQAIAEYLHGLFPSGSGLHLSGSLEPALPTDADIHQADVSLANVSLGSLSQVGSEVSRAAALAAPFNPVIDYKRLVHPRDWARGLKEHPDAPWKVYDLKTCNDWRLAEDFIRRDADKMELGPDLLKKIHVLTAKHLFYADFEARRIKFDYSRHRLSYGAARQALLDLENKKTYTGRDHSELAGQFRQHGADTLMNLGDQWGEEGRYFTQAQLERYRKSPFFHVSYWKVKQVGNDKFAIAIQMPAPRDVKKLVDETYERARRELSSAKNDDEYIAAVLKLEQALISIHPFLDGNGRSIRLQSDLLFRRRGIPPPLYPKDGDFTATPDELYQTTLQGVGAYVGEKAP